MQSPVEGVAKAQIGGRPIVPGKKSHRATSSTQCRSLPARSALTTTGRVCYTSSVSDARALAYVPAIYVTGGDICISRLQYAGRPLPRLLSTHCGHLGLL